MDDSNEFQWEVLLRRSSVRVYGRRTARGSLIFLGSGFFVGPGFVVTARHVVESKGRPLGDLQVETHSGARLSACTLDEQSGSRMALLKCTGSPTNGANHGSEQYKIGSSEADDGTSYLIALTNRTVRRGDLLLAFGYPRNQWKESGDPSLLRAAGAVFNEDQSTLMIRVKGTSLNPGMSGGPVLNLETGGVCGVIDFSQPERGEGHALGIAGLDVVFPARAVVQSPVWLDAISDEQLRRGNWRYPTRELRTYVDRLVVRSREHPHAGVIFDRASPPLSSVHVRQTVEVEPTHGPGEHGNIDIGALALTSDHPLSDSPIGEVVAYGGILLGDPGGGKTSALHIHTIRTCEAFLADMGSQLPITVHAADIDLERPLSESLVTGIRRRLFEGESGIRDEFLERSPLPGSRWHLLLDGLDEVLGEEARARIVEKATLYTRSMHEVFAPVPAILSRPLPPGEVDRLHGIVGGGVWGLQPFEPEQTRQLMASWFTTLGVDNPKSLVEQVRRDVLDNRADALLSNPLMITMLCNVVVWDLTRNAPTPVTRNELYRRFLAALQARFYAEGAGNTPAQAGGALRRFGPRAAKTAEQVASDIYRMLGEVALEWLITSSPRLLGRLVEAAGPSRSDDPADWRHLIIDVTRRSGVATVLDGVVVFLHETLGEYVAAQNVFASDATSDRALRSLDDEDKHLGQRYSFLRFAAGHWFALQRFREWFARSLVLGESALLETLLQIAADGVDIPTEVEAPAREILLDRVHGSPGNQREAVTSLLGLESILDSARFDDTLRTVICTADIGINVRSWAIVVLAGRTPEAPAVRLSDDLPTETELELALTALESRNDHDLAKAIRDFRVARENEAASTPATERAAEPLPAGVATRSRLSRFVLPQLFTRTKAENGLADLLATLCDHHPMADTGLVERAFATAELAHRGEKRESGEPYITHPVEVAQILADLGLDARTLAAGLLHDILQLTSYGMEELRVDFGDEIAMLVDGVTRLRSLTHRGNAQPEPARKMIVAATDDVRVLIIRLADRLHNARTWGFIAVDNARRDAQETLEVYAPLAHRLGLRSMECELEDLSFAMLHPKAYIEIKALVIDSFPDRLNYLTKLTKVVERELKTLKIKGQVAGRSKQYYSIYLDMVVRGRDFTEIFDFVRVRVIVDGIKDCYNVLSRIHALWNPLPGHYRDYIAMPKFNLYQAIHTTVIGPHGRAVEIQIRTQEMHNRAEHGGAARWNREDHAAGVDAVGKAGADTVWFESLSDWISDADSARELLDKLRIEVGAKKVYVFTPLGKVISLPPGATPLDFAYAVHTEIGHRAQGAKVNGRLVPLESILTSGDTVEIVTSKSTGSGPSYEWLTSVRSTKARRSILRWFNAQHNAAAAEHEENSVGRPKKTPPMKPDSCKLGDPRGVSE